MFAFASISSGLFIPLQETTTTNIQPSANQWVTSANPDVVQDNLLLTVTDTDFEYRLNCITFIRFDLTTLLDSDILEVTLVLKSGVIQEGPSGPSNWNISVSICSNTTWAETQLTWNNMPEIETNPIAWATINQDYATTSWDLTSNLSNLVENDNQSITLVLRSEKFMSDDWINFYGRTYYPEEDRPILRVEQEALVTETTTSTTPSFSTSTTSNTIVPVEIDFTTIIMVLAACVAVVFAIMIIVKTRKKS